MAGSHSDIRVSVLAFPEAVASTVTGLCDAFQVFEVLRKLGQEVPERGPFRVEIVGQSRAVPSATTSLEMHCHETLDEVESTDIVIIPAFMMSSCEWQPGRYPRILEWLARMHARNALICSACSGSLLLAETGLLDGRVATVHWAFEETFRSHFPLVDLRVREVLVVSGDRREFVMSGASASWHDLVLYLVARQVGTAAAQAVSKFLLLQWHPDGQGPYLTFRKRTDHGDAVVSAAQRWFSANLAAATPVEDMVRGTGLSDRTFARRFRRATGYSPIKYVQHLRVEAAKQMLETTGDSIDEVAWEVGYEDPAFFRRLFKRMTGVTPGAYRRKLQLPEFAREPSDNPRRGALAG